MNENEKGKILILKLNDRIFSLLLRNSRILAIQAQRPSQIQLYKNMQKPVQNQKPIQNKRQADNFSATDSMMGNIYVGKVKNISPNIGAAFVELKKGEMTFLSLAEAKDAVLTNRTPDGTIKPGDELLVQLVKEPAKTKLASVSARLSITGAYVIIEHRQGGTERRLRVSSKLGAKYNHLYKQLEPLQEIAAKFNLIIRTNAEAVQDASEVVAEAQSLAERMEYILEIGDKRTCFSCLYQCEPAYITFIKNCYRSEYDEIITDEKEIYEELLTDYVLKDYKTRFYEDKMLPLYKLYSIETRIKELTDKKVWLKSGAYLVIEQTEALIAIDVNTGKYESRKNQEETYLKINLEAAEEIAAQLRARNLSGMILVDFINMSGQEHVEQLIQYMKELLKKDVVPASVVDITGLGLMEITRKKKDKTFAEQMKG